jgi:hypothetical protein
VSTTTAPTQDVALALALAQARQDQQAAQRDAAVQQALAIFLAMRVSTIVDEWVKGGVGNRIYTLLSLAQKIAASDSETYMRTILNQLGLDLGDIPEINYDIFAGIASDNRDLDSLLAGAVIRVRQKKRAGASDYDAMKSGADYLEMVVKTQISDASRGADAVVLTVADDVRQIENRQPISTVDQGRTGFGRPATRRPVTPDSEPPIFTPPPQRVGFGRPAKRRPALPEPAVAPSPAPPARIVKVGQKTSIGWIRVLDPPSCGRCAILAGRFYKWSDGFLRHPNCFPAGTVISGPRLDAATRRWFEGELVTICTASGQELSVTGNHPVLTDGGWIPATLIKEGDNVIRSLGAKTALGQIPDDHQVPARVEDIFGALSVVGDLAQVPSAAEDFHGDGIGGEIDVVSTNGHLRLEEVAGVVQMAPEALFGGGLEAALLHSSASGTNQPVLIGGDSTGSIVGRPGLSTTLFEGHLSRTDQARLGLISNLNALFDQARADGSPPDAVLQAQRILAFACRVLRRDVDRRQGQVTARWDAPAGPLSMETRAGYTSRGLNLSERLTGQVAPDRVVEKVSRQWSGHVYNLTSSEGWMVADGIITSNCDCKHMPVTIAASKGIVVNPQEYFDSLSEEDQDRLFGKGEAEAIRNGADMNQVINATARKNGMYTADGGRRYTREGTTKKGFYGARGSKVRRPTPWQIMKDSHGDREVAIELLTRFGYIVQ